MHLNKIFLFSALFVSACFQAETPLPEAPEPGSELALGRWRFEIASPGGALPFHVTLDRGEGVLRAQIHNGEEVLAFDSIWIDEHGKITLEIDHYESKFEGNISEDGQTIEGIWSKTAGPESRSQLPFKAAFNVADRFIFAEVVTPQNFDGRWAVTFANGDDEPEDAVAIFKQSGAHLQGTFLTKLGDYRYLEGKVNGDQLFLSCFDGGHVFLFTGQLSEDGQIRGDFWSRDSWHDTWTAVGSDDAQMTDPFSLTSLKEGHDQFTFAFPDLRGRIVSHDDEQFAGKVRVIALFGSWCPNCNDEAPFLQELYDLYRDQGLEVLGLAFEMTPEVERSVRVLNRFKKRHKLTYEILIAGSSTDKEIATSRLPDLEKLIAWPTTLIIDRSGKVVSIHTGFNGPGTGELYQQLKNEFKQKIKALL